jgi:hypothetical protein
MLTVIPNRHKEFPKNICFLILQCSTNINSKMRNYLSNLTYKQEKITSIFDKKFECHIHSSRFPMFTSTSSTKQDIVYKWTYKIQFHQYTQDVNSQIVMITHNKAKETFFFQFKNKTTNLLHLCAHRTNFIFNKHPFKVNTHKKRCFQLKKPVTNR